MPPADLVSLPELPTKKHDAVAAHTWEVDQTAGVVLHFNTHLADLGGHFPTAIKCIDIKCPAKHAPAEFRSARCRPRAVSHRVDLGIEITYRHEHRRDS